MELVSIVISLFPVGAPSITITHQLPLEGEMASRTVAQSVQYAIDSLREKKTFPAS